MRRTICCVNRCCLCRADSHAIMVDHLRCSVARRYAAWLHSNLTRRNFCSSLKTCLFFVSSSCVVGHQQHNKSVWFSGFRFRCRLHVLCWTACFSALRPHTRKRTRKWTLTRTQSKPSFRCRRLCLLCLRFCFRVAVCCCAVCTLSHNLRCWYVVVCYFSRFLVFVAGVHYDDMFFTRLQIRVFSLRFSLRLHSRHAHHNHTQRQMQTAHTRLALCLSIQCEQSHIRFCTLLHRNLRKHKHN